MKRTIVFPHRVFENSIRGLRNTERDYCFASRSASKDSLKFLVKERVWPDWNCRSQILPPDERMNYAYVEISRGEVQFFTHPDERSLAALHLGEGSLDRLSAWVRDSGRVHPVDEIRIIGFPLRRIRPENRCQGKDVEPDQKIFDRLIKLMSLEAVRNMVNSTVCIIGAGRMGSRVYKMLGRLGIDHRIIIDPDSVEPSNLTGLEDSDVKDIGIYKIAHLKWRTRNVSPRRMKTTAITKNILQHEALTAAKQADFLINVTDSAYSRYITNILAVQYSIPYIDAGLTAGRSGGRIAGQVQVVIPDYNGCLLCREGLPTFEAFREQRSKIEKELAAKRGYPAEEREREHAGFPAFSSFLADYAIIQFQNLFCGFTPLRSFTSFDLQSGATIARSEEERPYPNCPVCGRDGLLAKGDLEPLPNI